MRVPHNSIVFALLFFILPFATPSHAFDCAKATTPSEKAICASPELKKTDDAMGNAYSKLRKSLDADGSTQLRNSQRHWLSYRQTYCEAEAQCMLEETKSRREELSKLIAANPAMLPIFIYQPGTKKTYDVKISGTKFAYPNTPSQILFNREFDAIISQSPLGEETDVQEVARYSHEISMQITRNTPRLISAVIAVYDYSGGAHPNSWQNTINIDMRNGKLLKASDLFTDTSMEKIVASCRDMILNSKSDQYDGANEANRRALEEDFPGVIKETVFDLKSWNFDNKGATITFNAYSIGSYAEGQYLCEFSSGEIEELVKDAKLFTP